MTSKPGIDVVERRGWALTRLASTQLTVQCLPDKGCDIVSIRPHGGPELLWETPWGLRRSGAATGGGDDRTLLMEQYPGGWQTAFPNAGPARLVHGVPWGMHGETWLAPFDVSATGVTEDGAWLEADTRLVRSPFRVRKRIEVRGATVLVTEEVTNEGGHPVDVMWSQHPAFSPALLGPRATVSTSARQVVVDPDRDTPTTDLRPGATSDWPHAIGRNGDRVDLRPIPGADTVVDRLLYLTSFPDDGDDERGSAWATITDPDAGRAVTLRWDPATMPHAWYWLESNATPGFPWYAGVRVLAIEPATSWPGAREEPTVRAGGAMRLAAGERRTHQVTLEVSHPDPTPSTDRPATASDER